MGAMSSHDDSGGKNSRSDTATARLVEQGIEFHTVLGRTVALAFLKEHQVPADIIYRILGSSTGRRQPEPSITPPPYER